MQVPYEYHRSQTLASKFALLALTQRQLIFRVIASASVAIPLKEYAVCTPYFFPTDCRGRYAPYSTIKANALQNLTVLAF